MKRQIRRGVFETNSSSVHSITMCSQDEYSKWKSGELLFDDNYERLTTREDAIKQIKQLTHWRTGELLYLNTDWGDEWEVKQALRENYYYSEKEFWDDIDFETFINTHMTPSGEVIHAFGYYGHD